MNHEEKKLDPAELERLLTTEQLDEVDYLKIRLLNRNVDFFSQQMQLAQLQSIEASRSLMNFSEEILRKYGLEDGRQIDVASGKITRNLATRAPEEEG